MKDGVGVGVGFRTRSINFGAQETRYREWIAEEMVQAFDRRRGSGIACNDENTPSVINELIVTIIRAPLLHQIALTMGFHRSYLTALSVFCRS